ncbi:MAG: hypothetical protein KAJ19_29960 [Gammaproteobacteria bacterium]|nr:hypothetical protein [Gammaproteobacteria bacterium]
MCEHGDFVKVPKAKLLRNDYYSKRDYVLIDRCMVDEIIEMNKAGIVTTGCCCGHGETEPTVVVYGNGVMVG